MHTQAQTLPAWLDAGVTPLTNAAAVYAATAVLRKPCDRWRALRVSPATVTAFDPNPVVPFGQPRSTQIQGGISGLCWPIYTRDAGYARGLATFLVALANGAETPELVPPKSESGLYEALRLGVTMPNGQPVNAHATAVNTSHANVWVQVLAQDGQPEEGPSPVRVDLTVPLSTIIADPDKYILAPEHLQDYVQCVLQRLAVRGTAGRRVGSRNDSKVKVTKDALASLEAEIANLRATLAAVQEDRDAQARLYADQLNALTAQMAQTAGQQGAQPAAGDLRVIAGYFATMLGYLVPTAPFTPLAEKIKAEHPALFEAIARKMHGG